MIWLRNYKIDHDLLISLLRTFYGALIVFDFWQMTPLLQRPGFVQADWLWPLFWLEGISNVHLALGLLLLFSVISHSLCMLFPNRRPFKILGSVFLLLIIAAFNSFGKIGHTHHGLFYASIPLALISISKNQESALGLMKIRFLFWTAQVAFLATYFLSGLWKLRNLISGATQFNLIEANPLLIQLHRNAIQSFNTNPAFGFLSDHPVLSFVLWVGTILFELLAPAIAWLPRYQRIFGIVLIVFHAMIAIFMNIYFLQASLVAVILFCNHPYKENEN